MISNHHSWTDEVYLRNNKNRYHQYEIRRVTWRCLQGKVLCWYVNEDSKWNDRKRLLGPLAWQVHSWVISWVSKMKKLRRQREKRKKPQNGRQLGLMRKKKRNRRISFQVI